jgi:hypothetical protein
MVRKLKTYQTSLGFFDLAVAAPSMKAALDAWGSEANLFHQGFAKETSDPDIVAAAMAEPGVVLRRPVGSKGRFSDHAKFPSRLAGNGKGASLDEPHRVATGTPRHRKVDDNADRKAALAYAKEQKRRDRERSRREAEEARELERRSRRIAKAETALKNARRLHDTRTEQIDAARSALDRQLEAEEARWDKQRERLQAALDRARG